MNPVRVAVLDHTAALGGAELALARLLDALDPVDVHVTTVLFADGPLRGLLEDHGHAVSVLPLDQRLATAERHAVGASLVTSARAAIAVLPFVWRLARTLRRLDVDLIHTTSLKADILGVPAAILARRPVVWHIHDRISPDYLPRPMVALIRSLARVAPRRVLVNSHATAATLPKVRATVAYPGLAPEQFAPEPGTPASPPRAPDDPRTVGILGRVSPTKGQREFLRAARRVHAARPDVRFRIIGAALFAEQDYERLVREEIRALGLEDVVALVGFASDPGAELDRLTLCVHASPTPEPFGQVVAEAMARGVPVVATAGGGVGEIVAPPGAAEPLGWLVPPGDVAALADAILEALDDPAEAQRRAVAAWRSVERRFPIAVTATSVTDVWRSVELGR